MYLNFKWNLFRINFNFDIEMAHPLQGIYDFRLRRKFFNLRIWENEDSWVFIEYALQHLPKESFIVFIFDWDGKCFVQFCNVDGHMVLDVPAWAANAYRGKVRKLLKLLRANNIENSLKKNSSEGKTFLFDIQPGVKNYKAVRVDFGRNSEKATELTMLIAQSIFQIANPTVFNYDSQRLIKAD